MSSGRARWLLAVTITGSKFLCGVRPADAVPLNDDGTINLSLRAYANVRIGTDARQSARQGGVGAECEQALDGR